MPTVSGSETETRPKAKAPRRTRQARAKAHREKPRPKASKTPHKAQSPTHPHKNTPHAPRSAHKRKIKATATQGKHTAHRTKAKPRTYLPLYTYITIIRPIIPYQRIIRHNRPDRKPSAPPSLTFLLFSSLDLYISSFLCYFLFFSASALNFGHRVQY